MTPKEKAKQLVDIYKIFVIGRNDSVIEKQNAKKCALIAVDEILDVVIKNDVDVWDIDILNYWQEVKTEIEKL